MGSNIKKSLVSSRIRIRPFDCRVEGEPGRPRLTLIHIFFTCGGRATMSFLRGIAKGMDMEVQTNRDSAESLSSERAWALSQFANAPLPDQRLKRGW